MGEEFFLLSTNWMLILLYRWIYRNRVVNEV